MAGNRGNKFSYQVHQDVFDGKSLLDENNFYNQRHGKPAELSQKLTWLLGDNRSMFPLALSTMGDMIKVDGDGNAVGFKKPGENKKVKELEDIQFTYPVMSRLDKAAVVASTNALPNQGLGKTTFEVIFDDNWIKRQHIIESPLGIQAYVHTDGEKVSEGYKYTLQLHAVSDSAICPSSELMAGQLWADLTTAVAESESIGTQFRRVSPGKMKNQMSIVRSSHEWAGNSANRVMSIKIQDLTLWMDFEMYQFEKDWLNKIEHTLWYSRYNREINGEISLKDILTGKTIPTGAGVLEQINNYTTYTKLSYSFLQNAISNALFGQSDTDGMAITLYTGKGGMREFDAAMSEANKSQLAIQDSGDKFIGQGDRTLNSSLISQGFFNCMYHIDGYTIKVKHNPVFDYGKRALKSPKHPETQLPLESYRMVFIDDGMYEGEPNLQMVCEKGRRFLHGVVNGLTPMPSQYGNMAGIGSIDSGALASLSSSKDASSYHRLATLGIQLKRGNTSLHMENVSGL